MARSADRLKLFSPKLAAIVVFGSVVFVGCGPEDYQKTVQQFQDASSAVISATESFLGNMNTTEQNMKLDEDVFEKRAIDLPALNTVQIISPEEIKLRTDALTALSQYTANLSLLAQGKAGSAVGDDTSKLSSSIKNAADDAKKLPATKSGFLNNPKFSGIASSAASAIGEVARLIVEHKARREIEQSVVQNDAHITALIQLLSDDAEGAYLRQKAQMGAYGDQLSRDYEIELQRNPDPILLLSLAKTIKTYRAQELQLSQADPSSAIAKMKTAHEALVNYIRSKKDSQSLSALVNAVHEFVTASQPLGQSTQKLSCAN
jgi:hypothetical protein